MNYSSFGEMRNYFICQSSKQTAKITNPRLFGRLHVWALWFCCWPRQVHTNRLLFADGRIESLEFFATIHMHCFYMNNGLNCETKQPKLKHLLFVNKFEKYSYYGDDFSGNELQQQWIWISIGIGIVSDGQRRTGFLSRSISFVLFWVWDVGLFVLTFA